MYCSIDIATGASYSWVVVRTQRSQGGWRVTTVAVVGTQWGDEGKGRVTDFLAHHARWVVRCQGGPNAGHTVQVGDTVYRMYQIPSGALSPGVRPVIGNGVVLDPGRLIDEMDALEAAGLDLTNLLISDRAHVILPHHHLLDEAEEQLRGTDRIGTTRRGIGPAYVDKHARMGVRMVDLMDGDELRRALQRNLAARQAYLSSFDPPVTVDIDEVHARYSRYAARLAPHVTDILPVIEQAIAEGENLLLEGAQATLLDVDFGTYPYVTSSNPTAAGLLVGAGIGPTHLDHVVGVIKAYSSRVGDGPFPTELAGEVGAGIRERGHEYGTTTGRPRRVGWLDGVILRHAARVNGLTGLAVNSLDVLGGLDEVRVATAYRHRGKLVDSFPASLKLLAECEPVYERFAGWPADLGAARRLADLPESTRSFLRCIEDVAHTPCALISLGRERTQMVEVHRLF